MAGRWPDRPAGRHGRHGETVPGTFPRQRCPLPSPPGGANVKVLVFHGSATAQESPLVDAGIEAIEKIGLSGPAHSGSRPRPRTTPRSSPTPRARQVQRGRLPDRRRRRARPGAGGGSGGVHGGRRRLPRHPRRGPHRAVLGLVHRTDRRPPRRDAPDGRTARDRRGRRPAHPATKDLPLEWKRPDQWFNWADNPSGDVHTVARVRESPTSRARAPTAGTTRSPGAVTTTAAGPSTPAWAVRSSSYDETDFRDHLRGALLWTTRLSQADCKATIDANYKAERLTQPNQPGQNDQIGEPHGLVTAPTAASSTSAAAAPTRSPVVTDWNDPDVGKGEGKIHVYDPATKKVTLAGKLTVFGNKGGGDELIKVEEGLLGIELDPGFDTTAGCTALHAAREDQPRHADGRAAGLPVHPGPDDEQARPGLARRSCCSGRCRSTAAATRAAAWPGTRRATCTSRPATTTPRGFSDGYSGNNPQPNYKGVSFADARRTAGNTNNLNGKILRIHPEADGTYTLPAGNLFTGKETAEGGGKTRGEIYVMGVRNPARISIDKKTDTLYAGWVGPDAGAPSTTWGPAKYDTFSVITEAGNHGWPYCMGNKQPYRDRNLPDPTKPLGWYDCDHLKNESPNNDGLVNIPPAQPTTSGTPRRAAPRTTRGTRTACPATRRRTRSSCCRGSRAAVRPPWTARSTGTTRRSRATSSGPSTGTASGSSVTSTTRPIRGTRSRWTRQRGHRGTAGQRRLPAEDHSGRQRRHPLPHGLEVRP